MLWEPWNTFNEEPKVLPIDAPPCPQCKFWKPQQIYMEVSTGLIPNGVKLCHNQQDMERDFSCFIIKGGNMTQTSDIKKLFGLFAGVSKKVEAMNNALNAHVDAVDTGAQPYKVVAPHADRIGILEPGDSATVTNTSDHRIMYKFEPAAFGLPMDPPAQKRPTPVWPAYDKHIRVGAVYVNLHDEPCREIQGLRQSLGAQDIDAILYILQDHLDSTNGVPGLGDSRRQLHIERLIKIFRGGFK
jgi:hypothetical protein